MNEWIGKKCKVFVRNLSVNAIVYTGTILSVNEPFITILDKNNIPVSINIHDIIQIKGEEEENGESQS